MSSLLRRPVITSATHVHAPIALPGSRTPLRIVASGRGWLRVLSGPRVSWSRFVVDGADVIALVQAAPVLRVEFRSLVGRAVVVVAIRHVLASAPAPVEAVAVDVARFGFAPALVVPDLRPPGVTIDLGVP
ncbi:MAG: hypothetical protein Q8O67_22015 [Deltaproteobacteria bacterium]|nr:hypothetical protein [Deltaproteobacteria bacterium]